LSDEPNIDEVERPAGEYRIRQATQVSVDFPQRLIELIVVPYESEATVFQPYGRMVKESIAPGAFAGVERRANRVRVNRDHQVGRTVGRAISLHPDRPEGLVARIRIARTHLGDETLALAEDDCLDASAAFLPMPGGEQWSRARDSVRLTKVWLGHIAMTPEPAYEDAKVLAVRSAPTVETPVLVTPNLDALRADLLRDRYDSLSR
jgi:HK97 family phage prohead protease